MPPTLLSADAFRTAAKDGGQPDGMVFRFSPGEPETIGETQARIKRFLFSDNSVDLAGDTIDQNGWSLANFKRNPVALFAHTSWDPPIGRASNVGVVKGRLVGDIEFATADIYPFADTIYRLVDGGYLRAVSVGFIPTKWTFSQDKNRPPYSVDFKEQILGEISICSLPCNPNALEEARSIGVDTRPLQEWAERVLDNGDTVFLPRKELESLRAQAKGVEPVRYYVQAKTKLTQEAATRIHDRVKEWREDPTEVLVLDDSVELRTVGDALDAVFSQSRIAALEEGSAKLGEFGKALAELDGGTLFEKLVAEFDRDATALLGKIGEALGGGQTAEAGDLTTKAGRRVSAATKAKLQEALDMSAAHYDAMTTCLTDVMGADDGDDDNPVGENPEPGSGPSDLPPGTVVAENLDHLTPEERRLKEARALKASLPTND